MVLTIKRGASARTPTCYLRTFLLPFLSSSTLRFAPNTPGRALPAPMAAPLAPPAGAAVGTTLKNESIRSCEPPCLAFFNFATPLSTRCALKPCGRRERRRGRLVYGAIE